MATMRFIIMAPVYTEWSGGVIVLHKLCHILNQLGENAYLHPMVKEYPLSWKNHFTEIKEKIKLKYKSRKYKTNKMLQTPVINKLTKDDLENSIIVYSEIVSGNPLKAKNVVRWFLHHPGYQTGNVNYFSRELYFSYGAFGRDFKLYGSHTSDTVLHVFHQMNDIYNEIGASKERTGTAYCIRKGQGRKIIHDLSDSILIDGKKHEEVAEIFKRVKYFISYDLYTGYSLFAIMCGCIPIVVPDENLSLTEWQSDPEMRLGIAYGFEQIEEATKNRKAALDLVFEKENESILNVKKFIIESKEYFSVTCFRKHMVYKMKNPFNISYYTDDELRSFGFKHVGKNVQVAQSCNIIGLENISLGNNVRIDGFTTIVASGTGFLNIGSYVHIGGYTFLSAGAGIIIKDFCGLSQGVKIYSKSDDYSGKKLTNPTISEEYTGVITGTVTLEKHVIIGSGTVVLPNITLEEGVSVGAQSLVTKDLNEWGMYFGCPAKKIRDREKELLILEKNFLASQELKQKN